MHENDDDEYTSKKENESWKWVCRGDVEKRRRHFIPAPHSIIKYIRLYTVHTYILYI